MGFSSGHLALVDCASAAVLIPATVVSETAVRAVSLGQGTAIASTDSDILALSVVGKAIEVTGNLTHKQDKRHGVKTTPNLLQVHGNFLIEAHQKTKSLLVRNISEGKIEQVMHGAHTDPITALCVFQQKELIFIVSAAKN